jgi:hypothetical protein
VAVDRGVGVRRSFALNRRNRRVQSFIARKVLGRDVMGRDFQGGFSLREDSVNAELAGPRGK